MEDYATANVQQFGKIKELCQSDHFGSSLEKFEYEKIESSRSLDTQKKSFRERFFLKIYNCEI